MDWPQNPSGGIDWETVFEHPDSGLIPLVCLSNTPKKLQAVTTLLVEQLFLRDGDAQIRKDYRMHLAEIFGAEAALDELKDSAATFLRAIKNERIARAGVRRDGAEDETDDKPPERPTEEIFASLVRDYIRARFDALTADLDVSVFGNDKPPFILSPKFAGHFLDCVETHFMPQILERNRGMIVRTETQSPAAREDYLTEQMGDQKFRATFVKIWTDIWKDLTHVKALPPKPEEPETGLLERFMAMRAPKPKRPGAMTLEEWEMVAAANEQAKQIWAEIIATDESYLAPRDDDNRMLMNLLGRTPGNIQSQIAAISQIVVQGGSQQAFDSYQSGRDLDLALLVASYRHPDVMLGSDGFTARALAGFPPAMRRERYPLVSRYLVDPVRATR